MSLTVDRAVLLLRHLTEAGSLTRDDLEAEGRARGWTPSQTDEARRLAQRTGLAWYDHSARRWHPSAALGRCR